MIFLDEKQLENLLQSAAKKLGMAPEALKEAAIKGDMSSIFSHMDKDSAQKVQSALNNKQFTDGILNNFKKKD